MSVEAPPPVERPLLADGIRRAIKLTGLTTIELARRVGVSPSTLSTWTTGATRPSEERLTRFARLTNTTVYDLENGLPELFGENHH